MNKDIGIAKVQLEHYIELRDSLKANENDFQEARIDFRNLMYEMEKFQEESKKAMAHVGWGLFEEVVRKVYLDRRKVEDVLFSGAKSIEEYYLIRLKDVCKKHFPTS